jgi:hypothetical protein
MSLSIAGVLKYSDSTPLAEVFPNPSRNGKKSKASPITAQDNATFYKTVKFNLEQQAKREAKVSRYVTLTAIVIVIVIIVIIVIYCVHNSPNPRTASLTTALNIPETRSTGTPTSATATTASGGTGRPSSLAVPGATDRPSISPLVSPMARPGVGTAGATGADGTDAGTGKSQRTTEAVLLSILS